MSSQLDEKWTGMATNCMHVSQHFAGFEPLVACKDCIRAAISKAVEIASADARTQALRDAAKVCDRVDLIGADECIEQINILINADLFPRSRATFHPEGAK